MITIFTTEDKKEALRIQKASDMAICLWEISTNIRRKYLKYDDNLSKKEFKLAERIFEDISNELNNFGLNLDDLTE